MKVRKQTLWRVPVYCLIASWLSFYVTVYLGGFFFAVETVGEDGVVVGSIDPVRSALFHGALFLIVLLLGGLWAFRSMTRAEIAVSAGIITVVYLVALGLLRMFPQPPVSVTIAAATLRNWPSILTSLLFKATGQPTLSAVLACLAPLLFIPFGRKQVQ